MRHLDAAKCEVDGASVVRATLIKNAEPSIPGAGSVKIGGIGCFINAGSIARGLTGTRTETATTAGPIMPRRLNPFQPRICPISLFIHATI